jgi:pyrimidine-specific ribonucleoside hydrolase
MTSARGPNTAQAPSSTAEGAETAPEGCSDESRGPMPIILDVDTGIDDACALLLAALHPDVQLRAVTCVGGNTSVDNVVRNTLKVLDVAGRADVPVARGAARPLLEPGRDARHVHGDDGMADLGWPPSPRQCDERHAVELLRDLLNRAASRGPADRITLVPLAPLTNIALLLRTYPEAAAGLREIVFMGGAAQVGNATASAEFNVWHDPEAAAIVLESAAELSIPVVMYGLDVFYDVRVSREQAVELTGVGGRGPAELAGRLMGYQCGRLGQPDATIGDAGAVCAVIDREGLTTTRLPVRVELAGTYSRGRTIVDRRAWSGDLDHDPHGLPATSVEVAMSVDADRYADLWLETVQGGPR